MGQPRKTQTALGWIPTPEQSRALDGLAMGLSQNAVARALGIPHSTISSWVTGRNISYGAEFRAEVARRARLFADNLDAIERQQVIQATALIGQALSGELVREHGRNPLGYDAAVELLRATRWRIIANRPHEQFGPGNADP